MTSINSISPAYTANVMREDEPKPGNPNFRGDNNEMVEVVNNNSKSANTVATAALVTSIATLIPVTLLAIKTHQLNNTAKTFTEKTGPILDNIKPLLEKTNGVASDVKSVTGRVKDAVTGVTDVVTDISGKVKGFIDDIVNCIKNMLGKGAKAPEAAGVAEEAGGESAAQGGINDLFNSVMGMFRQAGGKSGEESAQGGINGLLDRIGQMFGGKEGEKLDINKIFQGVKGMAAEFMGKKINYKAVMEKLNTLNPEEMSEEIKPIFNELKGKLETMNPEDFSSKWLDILSEIGKQCKDLSPKATDELKNLMHSILNGGIA